MGQEQSTDKNATRDCWVSAPQQMFAVSGQGASSPRSVRHLASHPPRPGSYAAPRPDKSDDFMGGAYIPEMMQGMYNNFGASQFQNSHSNAKATGEPQYRRTTSAGNPGGSMAPGDVGQDADSARRLPHGEDRQLPRRLEDAFTSSGRHEVEEDGWSGGRPRSEVENQNGGTSNPATPRRSHGHPITPRASNSILTPRSSSSMLTPRGRNMNSARRDRSTTPETRDSYVAAKGGWIQTSVTISDMSIAAWTQQKQDMFIEAVAATAQVGLSDVCVLSLKEKCGRRLLSIATEITFQVRATSGEHARVIVRELKSQTLDAMMLQANIRIRPDTARGNDAEGTPRAGDKSNPLRTPFRNGYSLTSSYQSQFGAEDNSEHDTSGADGSSGNKAGTGTPRGAKGAPSGMINGGAPSGEPAPGTMLL